MSTPTTPDNVFDQLAVIDKALARAQAALVLNQPREVIEQLLKAQALSSSLMFKLESERMPPAHSCQATLDNCPTPAPEQAVLL